MRMHPNKLVAAAVASILLPQVPARSQELTEIVVTATKRTESLQDVPISVSAVTGELLEEGGFSDMEDVSAFIPNLVMRDVFTGQDIRIRGIGTSTGNEAFEQAVAQFHDGVYYGRDNLGQSAFFDLERVEVVRGPQPTFAGQSATAGALNVVTRKPGDTWQGNSSLSYGSDEELSIDAAFGGPITDTFGIRVAGRYYELDDAGYKQLVTGSPLGSKENKAARIIGVWRPRDTFELTLKYEYQDVWQIGTPNEFVRCELRPQFSRSHASLAPGLPALCALDVAWNGLNINSLDGVRGSGGTQDVRAVIDALNAASGATPGSANYWGTPNQRVNNCVGPFGPQVCEVARDLNAVREFNEDEDREFQADTLLAAINWTIGGYTITSSTSLVQYDKEDWLDPDDSSFAVYVDHRLESFEQKAQELRLTSPTDQTLSWMVGLYWQEHDMDTTIDVYLPYLFNIAANAPAGSRAVAIGGTLYETSTWKSVFAAATYNITDIFRINAGARHQDVDKDGLLDPTVAFLAPNATEFSPFMAHPRAAPVRGNADESDLLPEVGFQWDITGDVMVYAKYAEAFKAGGFVMSPALSGTVPDPFSFAPERAEGYELGIKSRLFGNRVELNVALYDTDYTDLQVTTFQSIVGRFVTTNAAAAETRGVEIDGRLAVTDDFTLGFNGAFGKAEYLEYDGASCSSLQTKQWVASGRSAGTCRNDLAGQRIAGTPDWTVGLSPQYGTELGRFRLSASANVQISDDFMLGNTGDPLSLVDGYTRVDVRLGVAPLDGPWEVAIYGRDLLDERVQYSGTPDTFSKTLAMDFDGGGIGRDRGARYGLQLSYRFGQ